MGMYHETYFAFGAKINDNAYSVMSLIEEFEGGGRYNQLLGAHGVGWLMAGNYDNDRLFLTTYCESVDLGKYVRVDPGLMEHRKTDWTRNLQVVAKEIGVELLEEPSWFVIPDLS